MTTKIYVNQANIQRNRNQKTKLPVVWAEGYVTSPINGQRIRKKQVLCDEVQILDSEGKVVAEVKYDVNQSPQVWIETQGEVRVVKAASSHEFYKPLK